MSALRVIKVNAASGGYEVVIGRGALTLCADRIARRARRGRIVMVADTRALRHHRAGLEQVCQSTGLHLELIEIEGGETAKSWRNLKRLCNRLLDLDLERSEAVTAFGGGTIGDLTGFACAIVKRGTGFIQIPTTLLAQVDSSVGGKTGINTRHGKNLIGAFHQPDMVIVDTRFLDTLAHREVLSGYAEIVKTGLIAGTSLFETLESSGAKIVKGDDLAGVIAQAVAFKAHIVAADERDTGQRALLNLGHSFGHAFEAEAVKGALIHGEAVACGLDMAFRYSARLGICPPEDAARVRAHLHAVGLPIYAHELPGGPYAADRLLARMANDKKNSGGAITLVLARGIGEVYIAHDVDRDSLTDFLIDEVEN